MDEEYLNMSEAKQRTKQSVKTPTKETLPMPQPGQRVCVTLPYAGLRAMQVCVLKGVPDGEILEVCNRENPQLVTGGWHTVVRDAAHAEELQVDACAAPGQCAECPDRLHKIVICM